MTASHVFVTRGDILHIECDAWMVPTDTRPGVSKNWSAGTASQHHKLDKAKTTAFRRGETLVSIVTEWTVSNPIPVLTAIPARGVATAEDLAPAIRSFIGHGASIATERRSSRLVDLKAKDPKAELPRPIPLLAMPLIGTGRGGAKIFREMYSK